MSEPAMSEPMSEPTVTATQQLARLGLELPAVATPVGAYRPARREGDLIWTSGQLPVRDGRPVRTGVVGIEVTEADAYDAARVCALNAIAAAAEQAGGLDRLTGVVKVTGFVAGAAGFAGQPGVVNGASDLLGEVFGTAGQHARSAVGVLALPLGVPVEVEVVFRVD